MAYIEDNVDFVYNSRDIIGKFNQSSLVDFKITKTQNVSITKH